MTVCLRYPLNNDKSFKLYFCAIEYNNAKIELEYSWKTDEYMVAVLFKRKIVGK